MQRNLYALKRNPRSNGMYKRANMLGWVAVFLNGGAQLILAPVIKYRMGADGLGVWHLIFQTFVYLQLVDFGWSNGIVREIASVDWDNAGQLHAGLIKTMQRVLSTTGVLFAMAGIGAVYIVPRIVQIPPRFQWDFAAAILLLAVWGMARYCCALPMLTLRGRNRMVASNVLDIIQGAGRPVLGASMAFAHMGLVGIAAGYVSAEAVVRWIARCWCPLSTSQGKFDRSTFYRTLKFGGATGVISLSTLITFYSSSFIVGWKLGVTQVAVYQSSIAFPLLLMRLSIIPFSNRLPFLISSFQCKPDARLMISALQMHLLVTLASVMTLLGICMINESFVAIWVGSEFFAGIQFCLVFSLFLLMSIVRHNGFMVWQARGQLNGLTMAHIVEVPVTMILFVVLIDRMGLIGIAWALVFATLPSAVISQFAFYYKKVYMRHSVVAKK
jgi:O-antigen/teichoic acid export membrane protein